jgi:hypothetical protein
MSFYLISPVATQIPVYLSNSPIAKCRENDKWNDGNVKTDYRQIIVF